MDTRCPASQRAQPITASALRGSVETLGKRRNSKSRSKEECCIGKKPWEELRQYGLLLHKELPPCNGRLAKLLFHNQAELSTPQYLFRALRENDALLVLKTKAGAPDGKPRLFE